MKKTESSIKDIASLNQLDNEGLNQELNKAKKELFVLKMKHYSNELKETHLIRMYKKYIARLNTFLSIN
ncbi:MAG: 50S ribosomal protein L29 [Candidatus Gracilibacteria bacterium]|nr:50S ribosomal protein L29 [Candidatus Gracilibacteria bacterium]